VKEKVFSVKNKLPSDGWGKELYKYIYPNKIIAWYATDWGKWCHTGSRDIVYPQPTHWKELE